MAIKSLEQKKKQQKMMIILGAIVVATLLILYFGLWNKSVDTSVTEPDTTGTVKVVSNTVFDEKLKKIDLNTDFLTGMILPVLQVYGIIPVEKGTTGNPNPFVAH